VAVQIFEAWKKVTAITATATRDDLWLATMGEVVSSAATEKEATQGHKRSIEILLIKPAIKITTPAAAEVTPEVEGLIE